MFTTKEILDYRLYGNATEDYLIALGIFAGAFVVLKLFQLVALRQLKKLAEKTHTRLDDEIINIVRTIKPRVYTIIALYAGLQYLFLHPYLDKIITILFLIVITWEVVHVLHQLTDFGIRLSLAKTAKEEEKNLPVIRNINLLVKIALWSFGFLFILSQLGVNITSLIAGLGVGGIAVALALQNVLGDLFSSFSIYFDKPFQPGDYIMVGEKDGTVETIGLKTTRIRTLRGEELIISNRELTSAQVHNFGKMEQRRVQDNLGLTYETPTEKLKKIPSLLEDAVAKAEHATFERAHFKSYGDFALNFEMIYYIDSPDYERYMDVRQAVNFNIREAFEKEGLDMAYPTQTIFLQK